MKQYDTSRTGPASKYTTCLVHIHLEGNKPLHMLRFPFMPENRVEKLKDLEASRVSQHAPRPVNEFVQAAHFRDEL